MIKKLLDLILPNKSAPVNNLDPIFVKFKSDRVAKEFKALPNTNKELYDMLVDLSHFIKDSFSKELIITMIQRTQTEQDEIYKNDPKYKQRKFISPHQLGHSADIRSLIFDKLEISKIEDYLNEKYNATNYYKWTAKCHTVPGQAEHFHLQFIKK